jgi:small subunit ribosomal protein S20
VPVIKSAKKKLRQDIKREKTNNLLRSAFKNAVKDAEKGKSSEKVLKAVRLVDKAVKNKLIHKNKAARIKSRLSKLAKPVKKAVKTVKKPVKKTKPAKSKK